MRQPTTTSCVSQHTCTPRDLSLAGVHSVPELGTVDKTATSLVDFASLPAHRDRSRIGVRIQSTAACVPPTFPTWLVPPNPRDPEKPYSRVNRRCPLSSDYALHDLFDSNHFSLGSPELRATFQSTSGIRSAHVAAEPSSETCRFEIVDDDSVELPCPCLQRHSNVQPQCVSIGLIVRVTRISITEVTVQDGDVVENVSTR